MTLQLQHAFRHIFERWLNTAWDSEIESLTSLNPSLIELDRRKTRRRHRVTAALAPRKSCFLPYNAPLAIRYPPDIRPRPLPGLIFSNIRPRSVTNWISTCGLNRFATCSLRSAEFHRVKPTANLVCVINEVTGAQLVTAAQHTLQRVISL